MLLFIESKVNQEKTAYVYVQICIEKNRAYAYDVLHYNGHLLCSYQTIAY